MAPTRGSGIATIVGALGIQLVAWCPWSPIPTARAAWCWDVAPPKCLAPVVTDGACEEGATIAAGASCTPVCSNGKVPSGSCTLECPPSQDGGVGDSGCTDDLAGPWWDLCGFAPRGSCQADLPLGTPEHSAYGSFECVDPSEAGTCVVVTIEEPEDVGPKWDRDTIMILVGIALLVPVGSVLAHIHPPATRILFKPGPMLWTPAALLGVAVAVVGVVAYTISTAAGRTGAQKVFALGLAAGVTGSLPIWWAFLKLGVHLPMKMSREAAWKVHIILGYLFLGVATAHGITAQIEIPNIKDNAFWALGMVGLVLMWVGVFPVVLHTTKLISYDRFKLGHFASMLGYILAIVHMIDHAVKFKTARSIAVTAVNILALAMFIVQKVYLKASAPKVSVESAEVVTEPAGQHVFLNLRAPGFSCKPGQWGHLTVPSLSMVPHPFTIVPGDSKDNVRFFIKVSGYFTQKLAAACSKPGGEPRMSLEGPYGEPALPALFADAVVFVLGGVGVTPALSLVAEAVRSQGANKTRVYWSLRSPKLLQRCAPLLEPHLGAGVVSNETAGLVGQIASPRQETPHCICLPQGADDEPTPMPLGATKGHQDLGAWMNRTVEDLASAGAKSALLFICGPAGLANAARTAVASQGASALCWYVHQEEFRFLPGSNAVGAKPPGSAVHVQPAPIGAAS